MEPSGKKRRIGSTNEPTFESINVKNEDQFGDSNDKPSKSGAEKSAYLSAFRPSLSKVDLPSSIKSYFHIDIARYIPVGCLRLRRSDCTISSEVWKTCSSWSAFAHPRDTLKGVSLDAPGDSYLLNAIQELLLNSAPMKKYGCRSLHHASWIRMEFKADEHYRGQVRIYVLPFDTARNYIDRQQSSLRRSLCLLLAQLDTSKDTWNGEWLDSTPMASLNDTMNYKVEDDVSLFHLFNTLPSPNPDPKLLKDFYGQDAMYRILDSDIEGLVTKMHAYQCRSAATMLQRELQPAQIVDPRLSSLLDQTGAVWYCDLHTGYCFRDPRMYEAPRGGICAETMGLGKTLICLALILATKDMSSKIPVEYSVGTIPVRKSTGSLKNMCGSTVGRTATPWKSLFSQLQSEGYDYSKCTEAIKNGVGYYFLPSPPPRRRSRKPTNIPPRKIFLTTATLVIVPANLVQQWRHEIDKHTTGLKVLVMNEIKTALPSAAELSEYDIILFSKQRFEKESKHGKSKNNGGSDRRRVSPSNGQQVECHHHGVFENAERICSCSDDSIPYYSPLKDLHFKRIITDEGHTFGNAPRSGKTEAGIVVDMLQISSRWIISGTPTQGLYGAEVSITDEQSNSLASISSESSAQSVSNIINPKDVSSNTELSEGSQESLRKQERSDLEKLGNIATVYLEALPWANKYLAANDYPASWSDYVMQPRNGSKRSGNMECLRSTLQGMIIRHRPEDISTDVQLPPLYQSSVHLEGSIQDKLSLNCFAMMIVSNAVTSERKDADYLFHPRQRKALQQLVSNLRQASFFWSGYTASDVQVTIDIAKSFLEKGEVHINKDDNSLLLEAIKAGECILSNSVYQVVSSLHEMPMYVENECSASIQASWSLDGEATNPTLVGATMVHSAQTFVKSQLWKEDPAEGLEEAAKLFMEEAHKSQEQPRNLRAGNQTLSQHENATRINGQIPALAGGAVLGNLVNPKKKPSVSAIEASDINAIKHTENTSLPSRPAKTIGGSKSALKVQQNETTYLDPQSPLVSAAIISTSSSKLSYLMDQIVLYEATEKIIVFYESDNVAYYIAQALECLQIKHLIYAKSLSSARRSQYVVTFNQSDTFRVLLMDVSQAAFGLNMSSASRVYFVNPVFSQQVEAQAVKRAHRIGQTKPVYVETLVLKGSIEEIILERKKEMNNEELKKCKTILDDRTMYDWIRNVSFLSLPSGDISSPDQMAKLKYPQKIFGKRKGFAFNSTLDPDADLIMDYLGSSAVTKETQGAKVVTSESSSKIKIPLFKENVLGKRKASPKSQSAAELQTNSS